MNAPVALIAGAVEGEGSALVTQICRAFVRAALGRGRRVVVAADPTVLWPVLIAALGFRPEPVAEAREAPPPPLIVVRSDDGNDSLEGTLFAPAEELGEDEVSARSWFDIFASPNTVDREHESAGLRAALEAVQPRLVLAVGGTWLTAADIDAANDYARHAGVPRFALAATGGYSASAGWLDAEKYVYERRDLQPPYGIRDFADENVDEVYLAIAEEARAEARLSLVVSVLLDAEIDEPAGLGY